MGAAVGVVASVVVGGGGAGLLGGLGGGMGGLLGNLIGGILGNSGIGAGIGKAMEGFSPTNIVTCPRSKVNVTSETAGWSFISPA